jgi:hypothetical protein
VLNDKLLHNFSQTGIENSWQHFKTGVLDIMDKHIPSKLTSTRYNLPWLNHTLRKMTRKKKKLYDRARKYGRPKDWSKFKAYKKDSEKAIKTAHTKYISDILDKSLEDKNPKPFWKYVKQMRKDSVGVAPIKEKGTGTLRTESKQKAEAINQQFKSVFTKSEYDGPLRLDGDKSPSIGDLHIEVEGVGKLLKNLSPNKASGPDAIPNRILKGIANEIAPFMTHLYDSSVQEGKLPSDWKTALVTPIYKKGSRHDPANYRPVSLTVVCCKVLEHIICRHMLNHLEQHGLLTDLQHGFRRGHSCETQLLITTHDILKAFDNKLQTDIIILDFSKAFDMVPHGRLLQKLEYMGMDGKLNKWLQSFLTHRTQQVVVDGEKSSAVTVDSGVPQGSVLGPLLFLCHINDLPNRVDILSQVCMFADDCLLYRQIKTQEDHVKLQEDLKGLEEWAKMWGMSFNPPKCYVMTVGRGKKVSNHIYSLCNYPIEQVQNNPYLGILLNQNMKWSPHINKITKKANGTLAFLRRNLKTCPRELKDTAYKALVRSLLDYSATIWDPYLKKDIKNLEAVQCRGARFVMGDHRRVSSVTEMLNTLNWQSLENCRREARLVMMYKVVQGLVAVPYENHIERHQGRTRAKNSLKLKLYAPKTETFRNSFFPRTIKDWNTLEEDIATAPSLETFKEGIHHIFD